MASRELARSSRHTQNGVRTIWYQSDMNRRTLATIAALSTTAVLLGGCSSDTSRQNFEDPLNAGGQNLCPNASITPTCLDATQQRIDTTNEVLEDLATRPSSSDVDAAIRIGTELSGYGEQFESSHCSVPQSGRAQDVCDALAINVSELFPLFTDRVESAN